MLDDIVLVGAELLFKKSYFQISRGIQYLEQIGQVQNSL